MKRTVLWVDDEIDLLKAHVIFLEKKGYTVVPVSNGEDAIDLVKQKTFDAILLDEMMPGMDGLSVLAELKNHDPGLPVIMITKSEEEHIMDDAMGSRISDYLIKPVNPNQIFTTLKRLLDTRQLRGERVSREYTMQANQNRMELATGLDHERWAQLFARLSAWDIEIEEYKTPVLPRYMPIIEGIQPRVLPASSKGTPVRVPRRRAGHVPNHTRRVCGAASQARREGIPLRHDCFRYDHWLASEPMLENLFQIQRHLYYSILPTATPFCRNALFAGLLPREVANLFPDIYQLGGHEESGMNNHESELLDMYLNRKGIRIERKTYFDKIANTENALALQKKLPSLRDHRLIAVVYNFIDLLSHHRSESDILQEIAPDDAAFRSLARSWFGHSVLLDIFQEIAAEGATVVVTTDHGSMTGERASIVRGDRSTSTNVRYKYGRNLKCNPSEVILVDDPAAWGLPSFGPGSTYLLAKDDYYLIYPNNYRQYEKMLHNTLQHGVCPWRR